MKDATTVEGTTSTIMWRLSKYIGERLEEVAQRTRPGNVEDFDIQNFKILTLNTEARDDPHQQESETSPQAERCKQEILEHIRRTNIEKNNKVTHDLITLQDVVEYMARTMKPEQLEPFLSTGQSADPTLRDQNKKTTTFADIVEGFVKWKLKDWEVIIKGNDKEKARVAWLEFTYAQEIIKDTRPEHQEVETNMVAHRPN
jgi:hypothetical protein